MDHTPHPNDPHGSRPRNRADRFLAALSLRRTLSALHSLTNGAYSPSSPTSHETPPHQRGLGLPLPLLVLGSAIAVVAASTTLWALSPWLALWPLLALALLSAAAAMVTGIIAMTPFMVSMTWSAQGSPTGRAWVPPTALTFAACALPLLSPLLPWWNALGFGILLLVAALASAYLALPALGRDIELDRARSDWDAPED